ncbi:MAG TPA: hypothetical protein GX004_08320 [Firmicutes bacterium]|jgi:hypothetical protein|nr:hypothetical protein [Bacillota bacterium]
MSLDQQRKFWIIFFTVLVLSAFIVPFIFFTDLPKVYGAFLFWNIFAIIAILSMLIITRQWRD